MTVMDEQTHESGASCLELRLNVRSRYKLSSSSCVNSTAWHLTLTPAWLTGSPEQILREQQPSTREMHLDSATTLNQFPGPWHDAFQINGLNCINIPLMPQRRRQLCGCQGDFPLSGEGVADVTREDPCRLNYQIELLLILVLVEV